MQSINCTETTQQLDAYHDGELSAEQRASIDKHLSGCPACIAKLQEIDRVVFTLKTTPQPAFPAGLADKLDKLIDKASQPKATTSKAPLSNVLSLRATVVAPLAVAAVSLALFIAYKLMAPTASPPPTASRPVIEKIDVAQMQPGQTPTPDRQQPAALEQVGRQAAAEEAAIKHPDSRQPPVIAVAPKPLSEGASTSRQSTPAKIARVTRQPASPVTAALLRAAEPGDSQLADLPTNIPSLNDTLGIATDEDGLYDIKM